MNYGAGNPQTPTQAPEMATGGTSRGNMSDSQLTCRLRL